MVVMNPPAETQNPKPNLRPYWYFWLLVTIFLVVMVRYPIRIHVAQSIYSALFYGVIALGCLIASVRIYRRKFSQSLTALVLLCVILSGWQVVDLLVLRARWSPISLSFCPLDGSDATCVLYHGSGWYTQRFVEQRTDCETPMLVERYLGNQNIAIVVSSDRNATWYPCGG